MQTCTHNFSLILLHSMVARLLLAVTYDGDSNFSMRLNRVAFSTQSRISCLLRSLIYFIGLSRQVLLLKE